jgi:hypothetical protein
MRRQVTEQLATERRLAVTEIVNDEVVRTLMQKMRALAREESFRMGRPR